MSFFQTNCLMNLISKLMTTQIKDKNTFQIFINSWAEKYEKESSALNLFQPEFSKKWDLEKKQKFVKLFYTQTYTNLHTVLTYPIT